MRIHSNATTNKNQRLAIQQSSKSYRSLADQYGVSISTIHHWKHRSDPNDRSCAPWNIRYAISPSEEVMILFLRKIGLTLDEILDNLEEINPSLKRITLYRLLKRHGVNRDAKVKKKHSSFKEYDPGFIHVDHFRLPRLDKKKRYCFVAVDRATRMVLLQVYEHKSAASARDFLKRCLEFFPFKIRKLLTDNGKEFTQKHFKNRYGTQVKKTHAFESLCNEKEIEHRTTRPYTPKTNGLVERMNGLIQEQTVKRYRYASVQLMLDSLDQWMVFYNFHRKHRQIGRKTPYEKACEWYQTNQNLFTRNPTQMLNQRSQSGET